MIKNKLFPKKIHFKKFFDQRGYLQEIYNFKKINFNINRSIVSYSKKNVIRGMHFSKKKEHRLLYVLKGEINDYCVELSKKPKIKKFNLKTNQGLIIPNNFAHGYECLKKENVIIYFLQYEYNVNLNSGFIWNDKNLNIKWTIKKPILSKNDLSLSEFKKVLNEYSR